MILIRIIISNQKEKGDFYEKNIFITCTLGTNDMGNI